jgi:hypothetical protein
LDDNDTIRGNPIINTEESRRASIRRRLIKKRVKYREKKNVIIRDELRMKDDEYRISIKKERNKEPPQLPKDELSKRSIKAAASTLHGLTVSSKNFQKMSNWRRIERDVKKF